MHGRIIVLVSIVFVGAVMQGQSMPIQVHIAGHVTVMTSDSLARTAVLVTGRASRDGTVTTEKEFLFCIAHPEPTRHPGDPHETAARVDEWVCRTAAENDLARALADRLSSAVLHRPPHAAASLDRFLQFYNYERTHRLRGRTPAVVFKGAVGA